MGWVVNATAVALAAASPAIGSFVAAAADRLPRGETILWGRSKCRSCRRVLTPWDLVPIVSFLLLRGRCRSCGGTIPRDHLVAEGTCLAVTLAALALLPPDRQIVGILLTWALFALAWFDLRQWRLPNVLTVSLALAGLLWAAAGSRDLFIEHLIGATLGCAAFAAIASLYRAWRGREGLGGGDIKMLGAAGAWLGWQALPWVVLISSFGALAFAIARGQIAARDRLPFGPFLAAAMWAGWVWF
jgi:leader peptidase (prepilin peptidase)/N-methyltransferase